MPSAVSDHAALSLDAIHLLAFRNESVRLCTEAIPNQIPVFAAPDLVLSLSGTHDREEIPAKVVAKSHIANHLVQYLRMNAAQLGLDYVSGIVHEPKDSKPKLIIRTGRPSSLQLQRLPTCGTLVQLELAYNWQTSSRRTKSNVDLLTNPFSSILSLPYQALLNTSVERFVSRDLVKCYPLIFGPWHRQLDIEALFFPIIHRSIRGIVDRSPNPSFKEKFDKLFMTLRENLLSKAAQSAVSLSKALDAHDPSIDPDGSHTSMSESDTLCLAMERLFQEGMPPPKFKGSRKNLVSDRAEDEELSQKMSECSPDEVPGLHRNVLWEPHSEDAPNAMGDSMDRSLHSSYGRFPFGLYEPLLFQAKIHRNSVSKDPEQSPPIENCIIDLDNDSELLQNVPCDRADELQVSIRDDVGFLEPQYFCRWNGDIHSLGAALMNDDDTDKLHSIGSWPASDYDRTSEQEPLFAMDEYEMNSASGPPTCDEWTMENLFAHEESEWNQSAFKFSDCGMLDTNNDIDLLSEASSIESTTNILDHES